MSGVFLYPHYMGEIKYLEHVGDLSRVHFADGTSLFLLPDGRGRFIPRNVTVPPVDPPVDPPPTGGAWQHPLPDSVITSGYGLRQGGFHYGHDWSSPVSGRPVFALTEMVITKASDNDFIAGYGSSGAGTHVKGHMLDGTHTFAHYHMITGSLQVAAGQTIPAGTIIGTEGSTGNSTGRHLHFEVYAGNYADPWVGGSNNPNPIDPVPFLESKGITP